MLLSDGKSLFVGCDVPDETTADGFDQFRFYLHVDISPLIKNERLHIGRSDSRALRSTNIMWEGESEEKIGVNSVIVYSGNYFAVFDLDDYTEIPDYRHFSFSLDNIFP